MNSGTISYFVDSFETTQVVSSVSLHKGMELSKILQELLHFSLSHIKVNFLFHLI